MQPLLAELHSDEAAAMDARRKRRRTLRLEVPAFASADAANALIHDLSEAGLSIECSADLKVGDVIRVDLPELGGTDARIVWKRDTRAGCEFLAPVPKAAVSAALLQAPLAHSRTPVRSVGRAAGEERHSRQTSRGGLLVGVLLLVALAYLAATSSVSAVLAAGAIIGVLILLLVAWGSWIENNIHF